MKTKTKTKTKAKKPNKGRIRAYPANAGKTGNVYTSLRIAALNKSMEIKQYIESNIDEMTAALGRLVKIPSVSGEACGIYPFGKSCGQVLDEFLNISAQNGFYVRNYDYYAGSVDFYPEGKPELGILAHLDVVPVNERDWSFAPFELTQKDGRLYGRGTQDDKGPLIAALFAMKAVRECGFKLKHNVRLIVGCSEETGSETDIREYCKRAEMPPMVFTPDGEFPIITTEKGMLRFGFGGSFECEAICSISAGTVVNAVPSEASAVLMGKLEAPLPRNITAKYENGSTTLICKGKAAHASTPEQGENALTGLLSAIAALPLPQNDLRMVRGLLKIFPHGETNASSLGLDRTDRSGSTTCVLSVLSFENGRLSCKADIRFPVSFTNAQVQEKFKAAVKAAGFEFLRAVGNEPHSVPEDSRFVQSLLKVYNEVTGLPAFCKAIGGGTYVHGIEGGVAFGMEFDGEENNIHGADEWLSIKRLAQSAEIYAKAVIELCG